MIAQIVAVPLVSSLVSCSTHTELQPTLTTNIELRAAQACTPISRSSTVDERYFWIHFIAKSPGVYCLTEDLVQRKLYGPLGSPTTQKSDRFLSAAADDVVFDLRGKTIQNNAPAGATAISQTGLFDDRTGTLDRTPSVRRQSIRNGTIRSPFEWGTGIALTAQGGLDRPAYLDTSHVIENMKIHAGGSGIEIKGRGNIIRNSYIVIESPSAIDSWGPDAIIENNIIEIRPRKTRDSAWRPRDLPAPDTAIRLLDADGTIIRNNEIRFHPAEFFGAPHPAAIGLTLSKNVIIEGNQFIGFQAIVTKDESSSTTERNNKLESAWR